MENLKIYAVLDKSNSVVSNVYLSTDNAEAGRFMYNQLKAIYNEVPKQLRHDFLDRVHASCIVKLGEIDCLKKELSNDYNVICDFFDLDFEEVHEDGRREESTEATF